MSDVSDLITDFLGAVEEVAGSNISAATASKLKIGATILGEAGDFLESALTSRYPNIEQIIAELKTIVSDAEKLEGDTVALIRTIKGTTPSTSTSATTVS